MYETKKIGMKQRNARSQQCTHESNLPPEPAIRMADIRDVTDGIFKFTNLIIREIIALIEIITEV